MNPSVVSVSYNFTPTTSLTSTSFVGGKKIVIAGAGFANISPENNLVSICRLRAAVIEATTNNITIIVPPLVTNVTQSLYSLDKVG